MHMFKFSFFTILLFLLVSCQEEPKKEKPKDIDWDKKKSSDVNRKWVENEELQIDKYVERRSSWDVTKTGTGLRYFIYDKNPEGDSIYPGMEVHLNYKVELLDGTLCYTSDSTGTESFIVDHEDIESGLHEGIKYFRKGEKGVIIIPHYLAHGLIGDRSMIPPLSTVIYTIEVVEITIP